MGVLYLIALRLLLSPLVALALSTLLSSSSLYTVTKKGACRSRSEAADLMDTVLLRSDDKGERMQLTSTLSTTTTTRNGDESASASASAAVAAGMAVAGNDPRLFDTYGEFPLTSLDILLDRALELWATTTTTTTTLPTVSEDAASPAPQSAAQQRRTVIDLGSGCGRLALYVALSRSLSLGANNGSGGGSVGVNGYPNTAWNVHGIEQSTALHQEALRAADLAVDLGHLEKHLSPAKSLCEATATILDTNAETTSTMPNSLNSDRKHLDSPDETCRLELHLGSAADYISLLQQADIIFCYSTAFASSGFSPDASALILGREWNDWLVAAVGHRAGGSSSHRPCLVITTDKALDPRFGWKILDRITVPNPEVWESTGYIHQLDLSNRY
jgi:hypothetical protein